MELRHLRYFVNVAELGSVSRAAEKLFVAQPALSQQIRQLEAEIGTPLFERLPRGVRLTPAGESFLEDARTILARAQQAQVRARDRASGLPGSIRIALVPTTTHSVLPGVLRSLREAGIDTGLEVREMITSRQAQALRSHEIDLGLARAGEDREGLETVATLDDPYCLAVPAASPLAKLSGPLPLQQAAREHFVGFSRHREVDFFDHTASLCLEAGFTPDIRHEASQFANVLALVGYGLGVAIVPASASTLPFSTVVFKPLRRSSIRGRLALLRAPDAPRHEWTDQAAKVVAREMRELGARLRKTMR
ncbi:MAG TPA: LysR substrate-binding domain-containing protein [Ramlibacter sp.]|nr:LysR substrate-binding domain-containing protein [Ramlibacter sp.]